MATNGTEEELEDPQTVVATVIACVAAAVLLWTAFSFRMHRKAKDAARGQREEASGPTHKDIEHVRALLAEQVATGKQTTLDSLLADIAGAPAMCKLGEKALQAAQRKLRKLHAVLQKKGIAAAAPEDGEGVARLLLAYQLHSQGEALQQRDARLEPAVAEFQGLVADGALYMLPSLYEASVKAQWLSPALAALSLQVCLRNGLWSDLDPKCVDVMIAQLKDDKIPYPALTLRASAKSWMRQPAISPGTMVEVEVVVERAHAGPSGAKYQKKVPTRHGTLEKVMETYACLVSRETDTEGGSKGSLIGTLDVDVFDLLQDEARSTLKMVAPKTPGTYELRVQLRSAIVLGVRAETTCSFSVAAPDAQPQQEEDDDYD